MMRVPADASARIVLVACSSASLVQAGGAAAYPWPFKPFDQQHPIRGFFGDPRTVYENGILAGGFDGPGLLLVPPGDRHLRAGRHADLSLGERDRALPRRGDAERRHRTIDVDVFQYFHIVPIVGEGQQVIATQDDPRLRAAAVRPRAPHGDRRHARGQPAAARPPDAVHGPHEAVIRDVASATRPGRCRRRSACAAASSSTSTRSTRRRSPCRASSSGLPVAPSLVRWTVTQLAARVVVPWRTAADFRTTLPANAQLQGHLREGHVRERAALRHAAVHLDARPLPLPARRQLRHDLAPERRLHADACSSRDGRGQRRAITRALLGAERAQRRLPRLAAPRRRRRSRRRREPPPRLRRRLSPSSRARARTRAGRSSSAARPVDVRARLRELDVLARGAPLSTFAWPALYAASASRSSSYFVEQVVQVPRAVADVDLGVVEIGEHELRAAGADRDPLRGRRLKLHQADRARARLRVRVELRLLLDHGREERRIRGGSCCACARTIAS